MFQTVRRWLSCVLKESYVERSSGCNSSILLTLQSPSSRVQPGTHLVGQEALMFLIALLFQHRRLPFPVGYWDAFRLQIGAT